MLMLWLSCLFLGNRKSVSYSECTLALYDGIYITAGEQMLLFFTQLLSVVFAGLNFSSPFAITSCISNYTNAANLPCTAIISALCGKLSLRPLFELCECENVAK